MTSLPDRPGRTLLPALAVADLLYDLTTLACPSPHAPLTAFQDWNDARKAAAAYRDRIQAEHVHLLCRFCGGWATVADEPCSLCEATGLSDEGRRTIRFHHNGRK